MSRMEALAAEAARTDCRNCKRWYRWEGDYGRCGKYNRRIVMTHMYDTCDNFSERKEVKNGK
jgi:hypothetical protein